MTTPEDKFSISRIRISGFKKIREPFTLNLNESSTILVGNNGVGKTTVIEAVNLALSGRYRDAPIGRCISEYLFNKDEVNEFFDPPNYSRSFPEIQIDIYLKGGSKSSAAKFSGAYCPEKAKQCGFSFRIAFNPDYLSEVKDTADNNWLDSLPVEYYEASWMSFAGEKLTPRGLPVTCVLLNPNGDMRPSYGTDRATKSLLDVLDKEDHLALSQGARKGKDGFRQSVRNSSVNSKLSDDSNFKVGKVELDVNIGSADSWYRDLTIALSGVPYENIGAGPQCLLQSEISFGSIAERGERQTIVLIEEPENHLSYGNLNRLLSLLEEHRGRQFLCTTHSSFVANKLGLQNLVVVGTSPSGISSTTLKDLPADTYTFFRKLPGFETLRLALVEKAILVEGPSDELIVQHAYRDKFQSTPLDNGIDVISVGLAFERFLAIAKHIKKKVAIITDNDGDPNKVAEKYASYLSENNIQAFYDPTSHDEPHERYPKLRLDTLEATLVRSAGREILCTILSREDADDQSLIHYMETHKTDSALAVFDSEVSIKYPQYITEAINWIGGPECP